MRQLGVLNLHTARHRPITRNTSYPGRDIIVEGAFSPTRRLVRFFSPEHDTYSNLECHHFKTTVIIRITEINTRWLCPIGDSQGSLCQSSTRQDNSSMAHKPSCLSGRADLFRYLSGKRGKYI